MSRFSFASALSRTVFIIFGLLISIVVQAGTFTNASTALTAPATSAGSHTVSFKTQAYGTHYLQEKKNSGSWVNKKTYFTQLTGTSSNYPKITRNVSRSGLSAGTYSYRVKFVPGANSPLSTAYSNTKVTVVSTVPGVPSSITTPGSDNDGAFSVSWGAASGTVTGYKLQQQVDGGSWGEIYSGTSRSKAVSGLVDGTYKYRVRACNSLGCGGYRTAGNTTLVLHAPGIPSSITITEL